MKKAIYLDVCALSRPYDDQSQLRVRLETDAVLLIMAAVQNGLYVMMVSSVHLVEISAIKDDRERSDIKTFLLLYGRSTVCDLKSTRARAELFFARDMGPADAAHLAFAEAGADIVISCDDRFVRKARQLEVECEIMTPLDFCEKERIK